MKCSGNRINTNNQSIHRSMGSAPVGAQCPLTSSLGEFLCYRDCLWYPGLSPVLVSIALPFAFIQWSNCQNGGGGWRIFVGGGVERRGGGRNFFGPGPEFS